MMEKEFVPYQESLELKELGFDEPCFGRYDRRGDNKGKIWYEMPNSGQETIPVGDVLAPIFSQAFRWFRVKHGLYHYITTHDATDFEWYVYDKDQNDWEDDTTQDTYEEAELACLRKLIEIVKQNNE